MATAKRSRVVSVIKRKGDAPPPSAPTPRTRSAAQLKARASRKAAVKPLMKGKPKPEVPVTVPVIVRETPHVLKRDAHKPLEERLNPKLLEQLRTRKVTNAAAAEALGVGETYLSRVLNAMGEAKAKGATAAHREARHKIVTARRQAREMLAKRVNKGEMTIEKAAKEANCSVRTMFRYCAEYANLKKRA